MFSRPQVALFSLLNVALLPWLETRAQITTAECESSFSWMNNQKGQQPCLVAAYLMSPCLEFPSESEVIGLIQGVEDQAYLPPGGTNVYQATTCMCSSVTYSLLAACGLCQGFTYYSWLDWVANCPSNLISDGSYPDTIPSAVSVPSWAFLDVASGNGFDEQAAESVAAENPADITATATGAAATAKETSVSVPTFSFSEPSIGIPSVSVPSFSESSFSIPTVSVPTSESTINFHTKKKTNVGAIVGGIIGGISALLSAIGVWWLRMKKKAKQALHLEAEAPNSSLTPDPEKLNATSPGAAPANSTEYFPTTLTANPDPPPVLYNPNDPLTFPDAQAHSNFAPGGPGPGISLPPTVTTTPSHGIPSPNPAGYIPTEY